MLLREFINRTGTSKAAVVGWGRGMGHKGHMMLASSVITQANDHGADPYFVVSRTVGKDDPITPEEKLAIYKKVFPKHGHIFQTATDEMPDLTRVLSRLNDHGYTDVTVVVGADQKNALNYVTNYNGKPDKTGNIPFNFNSLNVIARQETNDPSKDQEGPRATPMRAVLNDPNATDDQKFQTWRDAMSSELSDDEVRDLMNKAHHRMSDPNFGKKVKKESINIKEANRIIREMRAKDFIAETTGKHHEHHAAVHQGIGKSRDPGGYNIPYHQLRTGIALAMADGSNKKLDVDHESWMGTFWTDHPFTELEHNMLHQARKVVPTEHEQVNPWKDSQEPKDTYKVSPILKFKNNKYGI